METDRLHRPVPPDVTNHHSMPPIPADQFRLFEGVATRRLKQRVGKKRYPPLWTDYILLPRLCLQFGCLFWIADVESVIGLLGRFERADALNAMPVTLVMD